MKILIELSVQEAWWLQQKLEQIKKQSKPHTPERRLAIRVQRGVINGWDMGETRKENLE